MFFYGEIYSSLDISIDWLQSTCTYHLKVSRGPHIISLGLSLIELVKTLGELGHLIYISIIWQSSPSVLDKFNKRKP